MPHYEVENCACCGSEKYHEGYFILSGEEDADFAGARVYWCVDDEETWGTCYEGGGGTLSCPDTDNDDDPQAWDLGWVNGTGLWYQARICSKADAINAAHNGSDLISGYSIAGAQTVYDLMPAYATELHDDGTPCLGCPKCLPVGVDPSNVNNYHCRYKEEVYYIPATPGFSLPSIKVYVREDPCQTENVCAPEGTDFCDPEDENYNPCHADCAPDVCDEDDPCVVEYPHMMDCRYCDPDTCDPNDPCVLEHPEIYDPCPEECFDTFCDWCAAVGDSEHECYDIDAYNNNWCALLCP